ncbi:hypothetical protein JCM10908_001692 [Rhodotorula pacifica]|uniref:uncharacterized protein n=1 Tax=Rhodotorula pacifica TaxID=1495444 RepID=UPI0031809E72
MLSPSSSRTFVRVAFLLFVALLASLLTARYKLEAPHDHPYGKPVTLGHQAWQVAFSKAPVGEAGTVDAKVGGDGAGETEGEGYSSQEDLWDEEDWGSWTSSGTSAKVEWDPLRADSTPFTELQIKTCVLSPGVYDMCSPASSAKEDATRGEWIRIDKDVNKRVGVYYLYIYARRLLPGSNADVITDLRLLNHSAQISDLSEDGLWVEVSASLREGVWPRMSPLFMHYKLSTQADVRRARRANGDNDAGALEPITELDVLYGSDEVSPLPGFTKIETPITGGLDDASRVGNGYGKGTRIGASLAYRRKSAVLPNIPTLRFSSEGKYKILQVADLHFSVGPGECRDMDPQHEEECKAAGADVYSLKWLETALDETAPDLVVFSGDQLNGQKTSWDAQSVIMKYAPLVYNRNIPWTIIFGNHDEEDTNLDHEKQMNLMRHLPLFIGESGPTSVSGVGNYVRSIRSPEGSQDDRALFTMYFLDSHANVKKVNPWANAEYDYIKADQINWFRGRSAQIHSYTRPYSANQQAGSDSPLRIRRRNRFDKRQADGDDKWTEAAVDELKALEKEFGIDESLSPAVEPDDGSSVVTDPAAAGEEGAKFEEDAATDPVTATDDSTGEITSAKYLEEQDELLEGAADLEPTVLPVGPTRSKPMEAKPNAILWQHIPLPQAYTAAIDVSPSGKRLRVGSRYEGYGAPKHDSGFWQQGILAQKELPASNNGVPIDAFWDGEGTSPTEGRPEVKVLAHGHCHLTSDCRRIHGVWVCFGGGGTYSGYGSAAFARRMRVFEISDYGETISTYQLTDERKRINEAVLYGKGSLEQR